uniref:Corrinoid adenosyltransferase MMAB n=1 Tax=Angiostrongylus cantonensis TaxID=6313 RepID=A0A158PB61_ANGCA
MHCIQYILNFGVCRELAAQDAIADVADVLTRLQCCLQDVGAHIATPPETSEKHKEKTLIDPQMVEWIHAEIDRFGDQVPPLRQFILSGGGITSAHLQYARAVCRRAERSAVSLLRTEQIDPQAVKFLNRMSDLLFVLGRYVCMKTEHEELTYLRPETSMLDEVRYDRQLRLWGEEGQNSISRTSVCVLGSSALGTEILKSLVLAGVRSVCVMDSELVRMPDLGQNFFLRQSDIGPYFVSAFKNKDVCVYMEEEEKAILSTGKLSNLRVYGLLGYIRVFVQEHTIANNHEENALPDLRIDKPFPKLLEMVANTNLESMTLEELRHTPYIILYLIALQRYKSDIGDESAFPDNYAERKRFLEILWKMRREGDSGSLDSENFIEAKTALIRSLQKTEVPRHVMDILMDENCDDHSQCVVPFWLICAGLRRFVKSHGVLPLTGILPDMTSDSMRYSHLASIFHEKALSDATEVFEHTKNIEKERGVQEIITEDLCYRFCKNARGIRLQRGTEKDSLEAFQAVLNGVVNQPVENGHVSAAVWFLLLKAVDKFHREKGRYPGTNGVPCTIDALDLKQRVVSIVSLSQVADPEAVIAQVPQNAIAEICRYGAGEIHVVASIVAQEVIKLATNQYVPLDNTFIYDGHTQQSSVFRM